MKAGLVILATILALATAAAFGYDWVRKSDFDRICDVATRFMTKPEYVKMDPSQRAALLAQELDRVIYASPARKTFQSIAMVDSKSKAALFRAVAEETRGSHWDCPALEAFFEPPAQEKQ